MDHPNCDWVAYKVHTTHSELEKNFREYQIINNKSFKRKHENGNYIYEVIDTRKKLPKDIERKAKIQTEDNFTHKSFRCRDKTCKDGKKVHVITKRLPFDQEPECDVVYCDDNNIKNRVHDRLEIKATDNMVQEIEFECHSPIAEQNLYFVSHRPLV